MDEAYLYVAEFTTGAVKVGFTLRPKQRRRAVRALARSLGGTVARTWLSLWSNNVRRAERSLLRQCEAVGGIPIVGNECFSGITFEQARAMARIAVADTQRSV